jgi:hypothetical protein
MRAVAAISIMLILGAGLGAARAQPAPATPAPPPGGDHLIKLTNTGRGGITAIFVARAGSTDVSDDLLGKQTAGPGKTVTLKVKDPKGDCIFDIQFLMNDGSMVTRKAVNLCQTSDYSFTP